MRTLGADNAEELWLNALRITKKGNQVNPRKMSSSELSPCTLILSDVSRNLITNPYRRLNYGYSIAELLWIWGAHNDVKFLQPYNKNLKQFSDDGLVYHGAYGPSFDAQLPYVLNVLYEDPNTRQAVMTFWLPAPGKSKDIPCTVMLHFMIRGGRLNLIVYMRSNDVWLGLPYDLFTFTSIQQFIAAELGIEPGTYTHIAGSLHLYTQDLPSVEWALMYPGDPSVTLPPIRQGDLRLLSSFEAAALRGEQLPLGSESATWLSIHHAFLNAYWNLKRGAGAWFPEPYATLRENSRVVRAKVGGSHHTRTVRGDGGGTKECAE